MKIQICSDLHLEWWYQAWDRGLDLVHSDADVLVIAGDLCSCGQFKEVFQYLTTTRPKCDIIYVPGNHEYYGTGVKQVRRSLDCVSKTFSKVHVLDNCCKDIAGVKFVGSTMWFPYQTGNRYYSMELNDFIVITGFLPWVYEHNARSTEFLHKNVDDKSIVVTHHLPSMQSVPEAFKTSNLNRFFVCDMEKLILDKQPKYWIHGHTHSNADCIIDKTRLVCNPYGYTTISENKNFITNLIIEA